MNSQRIPDATRNNDTLETEGRVTEMTAEDILRRLEAVDIMYRDKDGWHVIPGEESSAWFELGLESDEFITPQFRCELDKLEALGVKIIINSAEETKFDTCDPTTGIGTNN